MNVCLQTFNDGSHGHVGGALLSGALLILFGRQPRGRQYQGKLQASGNNNLAYVLNIATERRKISHSGRALVSHAANTFNIAQR